MNAKREREAFWAMRKIDAPDLGGAAEIADNFASSLTSITAAFAVGLPDEAPADPLDCALAFQRLSVEAAVLSRAIMTRFWRAEQIARRPAIASEIDLSLIEELSRAEAPQ